jgi:hypothetical protein
MRRQRRAVVHVGQRACSELLHKERSKNGSGQRQTLTLPLERRVAPLSMVDTKLTTTSTRLWDAAPLGVAASLSWAAVSFSSGIVGDARAHCRFSKLPIFEADTVHAAKTDFVKISAL